MFKPVLSAVLALSLIGSTAAFADPYHHDRGGHHGYRHHDNDAGAAVAVGLGLFALMAVMASQDRDRDRDAQYERAREAEYDDYRGAPPPSYYDDRGPNRDYRDRDYRDRDYRDR